MRSAISALSARCLRALHGVPASHLAVAAPRREPDVAVPASDLRKLGVLSWKLDADAFEADSKLEAIRNVRGYSYQVHCCNPPAAVFRQAGMPSILPAE